jgi:hypothetical protein
MDFLNKLGKKASETYQATKEKATNISEELKLKGKISELKEKINKIYIEIGENVYNELKDGKDVSRDEITAKCEEISKAKDEIAKLETDILVFKKIKKCNSCGTELDLEAEFCSKCGKEQPKIEKVEIKEEPEKAKEAEVIEVNDVNNSSEEKNENNEENKN